MAIRFATKAGNWSDPTVWNGGTLPEAGDDVYSNNFNVNIDQNITVTKLSAQALTSPTITAGGRFIVIGSYTINADIEGSGQALTNNNTTLLTNGSNYIVTINGNLFHGTANGSYALIISTTDNITINGNIDSNNPNNIQGIRVIYVAGTGQLTINGNVINRGFNTSNKQCILAENLTTITINGNVEQYLSASSTFVISTGGNLNVTGSYCRVFLTTPNFVGTRPAGQSQTFTINFTNIEFNSVNAILLSLTSELSVANVTGNLVSSGAATANLWYQGGLGTINYTGNISAFSPTNTNAPLTLFGAVRFYLYGNVTGGDSSQRRAIIFESGTPKLFVYGNVIAGTFGVAYNNFQNAPYGIICDLDTAEIDGNIVAIANNLIPAIASRSRCVIEHAISTNIGYFPILGRFQVKNGITTLSLRDETLQEVIYTDQTSNDYPSENNVRDGVEYGFSLEGNLIVPPSGNVSLNYNYDSNGSVTGSAILTPQDLFTAITDSPDPIAERLRNVSTVETTGDQIVAFFP
jgi:hypothetical protein